MYKVIGHPKSRSLRVIRALEEMEVAYELIPAIPHSKEILEVNPTGKIPSLIDGDVVITDSTAIMTYLADKHGKLTNKAGTLARAHQDAITQYILGDVDAALWLSAKHSFVLPEERRVPKVKETARYEFAAAMQHLETELGDQAFLTGDTMTIPDIILSHCAGWALTAGFDLPKGSLGDYLKRMRATPAMERIGVIIAKNSGA